MFRKLAALMIAGTVVAGCADSSAPLAPSRLAPYITPAAAVAADVVPDEYLVVLEDGSDVPREASRATLRGAKVLAEWESALKGYAVRVNPAGLNALRQSATIRFVTANQVARRQATQGCAPYTTCGWGLDRIDQSSRVLDGAYTYPSTASGVRVYVIDSGIRTTHTQFQGRASWGADFIDGSRVDCDGHGTHVAATIAGKDFGVAKGASVVAVRVLDCSGSGTYAQVISGINWVTRNAVKPAVANLSLGGPPDAATDLAVSNSIASGITYAVAAGNSGVNACNFTPARVPNAITVGATGAGNGIPPATIDGRPSYSNLGPCLDLFAPGSAILAAYNGSDTQTAVLSGTSMASPHVAGAAALLLARHGTLTPAQVRDTLVARSLAGVVSNAGSGSPNRLLNIAFLNTPGSGNQAPVARFTWACDLPTLTCTMDASTSTDDQGIVSFTWKSSDPTYPNKSGTVIYRYMEKTRNTLPWDETLTVADAQGVTHSVTQTITPPPLLPGNQPPVADFTIACNATKHYCDLDARSSSDDQGLSNLTFAWSTNDPLRPPRTGQVVRRFGIDGTAGPWSYTETLTVRDAGGLTHSVAKVVVIP